MRSLLVALFLLCTVLLVPSVQGSEDVLDRVGTWRNPPVVELCDGDLVDVDSLNSAIRWWSDLGYVFGRVDTNPPKESCESGNVGGKIIIQRTPGPLPQTRFLVDDDGYVRWAKVLLPGKIDSRILEHELGHALGWTHSSKKGHMMNGKYNFGGWSSTDLKVIRLRSFPGAAAPRRGGLRD
tara:strand:- start:3260 stop:3802 length:543 start_codon:yes stop_codon:yes gene_type:complete